MGARIEERAAAAPMPAEPEQALVERMLDPACYPHPAARVELVETHISRVFLAGEYAYKVKKPVRLPFLDFSTLEARRRYCEEELRLNRRTAPQVYLDVVALAGDPAAPSIGGTGPVLEYAVRMQRFSQEDLLASRARAGLLEGRHVDALAVEVARFHARAERATEAEPYGSPESVAGPAQENFAEIAQLACAAAQSTRLAALAEWTRMEQGVLASRFAQRKAEGFVRECHGDLHLGNVVMLEGHPVLFDAIEFSEPLRWTDVMSDVAFLAMDLGAHGLARSASRFLDRYLEETGDYGGLSVLRFYEVYRALVRAKVAGIRAGQDRAAARDPRPAQESFERHVELAMRLARRAAPVLVVMHGLSASGKSTAARQLVEALGAVRLRSDVERKRLKGLDPLARTGSALEEGLYAVTHTERTYERLAGLARDSLAQGYPVVVDATFLRRSQRELFRRVACECSAAFEIVSCEAPEEILRERIVTRAAAGGDPSEAGLQVLSRQIATQERLAPEEHLHAAFLDMAKPNQWQGCVESLGRRFRIPA